MFNVIARIGIHMIIKFYISERSEQSSAARLTYDILLGHVYSRSLRSRGCVGEANPPHLIFILFYDQTILFYDQVYTK